MSRSIRDLESLSRAALTLSDTEVSLPRRLLYLNASFGNGPSTEQDLMEQFVSAIEKCLHLKAEPINLTAVWAHDPPSEACGEDLTTYMGEVNTSRYKRAHDTNLESLRSKSYAMTIRTPMMISKSSIEIAFIAILLLKPTPSFDGTSLICIMTGFLPDVLLGQLGER